MTRFVLTGNDCFVCSWELRSGRTVAALHQSFDPDGWTLKGDSFGGWRPRSVAPTRASALVWATKRVAASYPHAKRCDLEV